MLRRILVLVLLATGVLTTTVFLGQEADPAQVRVYVLQASGGGWGATQKVGVALAGIAGVEKVLFCGPRATFTVKQGTTVKKEAVAAALTRQKMKLQGFSFEKRRRPEFAYVLEVTGGIWAMKAGKVRVALMLLPGVIDVFVETVSKPKAKQFVLLPMKKSQKLTKSQLVELLGTEELKLKLVSIKKESQFRFNATSCISADTAAR